MDMRGYGESSAPEDPLGYTPFHTVGDLVGLLDALDLPSVITVGHDFGASVAWNAAMMRPDHFHAVFGLSVPFLPRGERSFLRISPRPDVLTFICSTVCGLSLMRNADACIIYPSRLY